MTVIVIPEEVTVAGLGQVALEVILQVMTSPSESVEVVKVALVAPAILLPFLLH